MLYLYLKALHLISMVCWFAGLLYLVRLFVYHTEERGSAELTRQFEVMERRLWYGITLPAMFATAGFGVWLMILTSAWQSGWFHLKLLLVILLIGYHFYSGRIRKQLVRGTYRFTATQLRIWNEAATFFLVAMVLLAVTKEIVSTLWGVAVFVAAVMGIVWMTKRRHVA